MSEYEQVFEAAAKEAANGRYKDAYNTLGRALTIGGPDDRECRLRRGVYALRVGESRLDAFEQSPEAERTLVKASNWLSRSEAYLLSASEGASVGQLDEIQRLLQHNKEQQERFRRLCRQQGVDLVGTADEFAGD